MDQELKDRLERGDLPGALELADDAELRISLLLELGRYDEALEALAAVCRQHPDAERLWFARAHLAQKMQRAEEAHEAYLHLRRLCPRDRKVRALTQAYFESLGETFVG